VVAAPANLAPRGAFGALAIAPTANNVLAMVGKQEDAVFTDIFPTLVIKGGNAGGAIEATKGTPAEVANKLPQGKQTVKGVFLGYRVHATSWPTDFDNRTKEDRPLIDLVAGANDPALVARVLNACENFNYCSNKLERWAAAAGGPGLLRPQFAMLVYMPQFDDIVELRCPPHLESWKTMSRQLLGLADPATGQLVPFAASFATTTVPWYDKNVYHFWTVTPAIGPDGDNAMGQFAAFAAALPATRPDLLQAAVDWAAGKDRPMDADNERLLALAESLTNPRRRRA
jgi:hypothetical protein